MTRDVMSIDLEIEESHQRGRVFLVPQHWLSRDFGAELDGLRTRLKTVFVDADDQPRFHVLGEALKHSSVTIETYRGETYPYELHAYVRSSSPSASLLFACVLAAPAVVDALLTSPPHAVFETSTFQAIDDVSNAAVISGLERWVRRVWPGLEPPTMLLSPWPGATEVQETSVEILRLFPTTALTTNEPGPEAFTFAPPLSLVKDAERRKEVRKDKSIQVRVTDAQKGILTTAAEQAGLGVSSWLLMLGLREATQKTDGGSDT